MRTDIPLKRLTDLCGADLLSLFGIANATLQRVDTLELPATAERLDSVLAVRSFGGQDFLLVVEWQGYRDLAVLWRLAGYCSWIGQRTLTTPVIGVVVYLAPAYDVGDALVQEIDGVIVQSWPMRCVRLWEHDAITAVTSGALGLTVLSPLMQNASSAIVEQAIQVILQQAPLDQQADLLVILGVFGEPLIPAERFVRLVGKEQLMTSNLITYLVEEEVAEREARSRYVEDLQRTLEATIAARFPQAPLTLALTIHNITQPDKLHRLIVDVVRATDLATVEQELSSAMTSEADHEA
jgi:hypothetical protein